MMVHQVEAAAAASSLVAASTWCTIMISPLRNCSTAGSLSRRRVGKRKRPRKERLTPLPR